MGENQVSVLARTFTIYTVDVELAGADRHDESLALGAARLAET